MNELATESLVHFYDTRLRSILCGLRGFAHRSTKHPHGVTCQACTGLLGKRPPVPARAANDGLSSSSA